MRDFGAKEGTRIAIIGLGGLGTIGIKIAKHLGCYVTAVSRSEGKSAFAKQCGADAYIAVSSAEQMKKAAGSFDLVLNTIPGNCSFLAQFVSTNNVSDYLFLQILILYFIQLSMITLFTAPSLTAPENK